MKTILLSALLLALPAAAFAATYDYVNTSGVVKSIQADTASQAMATAPDIALNSGVMLVFGTVAGAFTSTHMYEYVNTSGTLSTIRATSADQAMVLAVDRAPNSGVMAF